MALNATQRKAQRLKTIELLMAGKHPAEIANREVAFDITSVYRIARENNIEFVKRVSGRKSSPLHLRRAAAAVKGGMGIEKAASQHGVSWRTLKTYMASQVIEQTPVETTEFEALRAHYRRHAAGLRWGQGNFA